MGVIAGLTPVAHAATNVLETPARQTRGTFLANGKLDLPAEVLAATTTRHGAAGLERLVAWQKFVNDPVVRGLPDAEKIALVNQLIADMIEYESDEVDSWQGPLQTIGSGKGDCEDYAIAKYTTLRLLGVSADKLWIAVGVATSTKEDHAVLYYRQGTDQPLLLDNRAETIEKLTAADFGKLYFEFNETKGFVYTGGDKAESEWLMQTENVTGTLKNLAPFLSP